MFDKMLSPCKFSDFIMLTTFTNRQYIDETKFTKYYKNICAV